MKLAAQSDYYIKTLGLKAGLERIKEIGFEAVSYTITERYDAPFTTSWTEEDIKAKFAPVGEAADKIGLKILCTEILTDTFNVLLPGTTEARTKMALNSVIATKYLGCNKMIARPVQYYHSVAGMAEQSKEINYMQMSKMKELGDSVGVQLLISNGTSVGGSAPFGCSLNEVKELVELFGMGAVYNPAAAALYGMRVKDFAEAFGDKFYALKVNDFEWSRRNPTIPFFGSVNYVEIIEYAKNLPDNAFVIVAASDVYKRYGDFVQREGVRNAIDKLLFDIGKTVIGKKDLEYL